MAELAIKGHKERGKEVIALLEMLGGKNEQHLVGCEPGDYYHIIKDGVISNGYVHPDGLAIFTLEEFEKEFPYKIGDKVNCRMFGILSVTDMYWNSSINQILYSVRNLENKDDGTIAYAKDLRPYNPEPVETSPDKAKAPSLIWQQYSEGRFVCKLPEDLELDKIEDGEIVLKPKKKELPKTYGECCEVLGFNDLPYMAYTWNRNEDVEVILLEPQVTLLQKLETLRRVITCRDAYWKLADDWSFKIGGNSQEVVYAITIWGTGILKDFYHALNCNRILVFPNEEMRDAFYENFKDLINECKELL